MEELVAKHGVNSFVAHMANKELSQLYDSELIQVFKMCRNVGALALVHAENGDLVAEVRDLNVQFQFTFCWSRPRRF